MRRILLLLLCCTLLPQVSLAQPAPVEENPVSLALHTGAASFVTRGERREYWAARATLSYQINENFVTFARGDLLANQDGGNLDVADPSSFRSLEGVIGARRRIVDRLSVGVLGGVTWSIEGDEGAPVDPRLWTALGVVRYALDDHGSYAYFGCGLHDPVGGGACVVSYAQQVIGGDHPTATFIDFALPFDSNAFAEKTWTLKVGAAIKVGEW